MLAKVNKQSIILTGKYVKAKEIADAKNNKKLGAEDLKDDEEEIDSELLAKAM